MPEASEAIKRKILALMAKTTENGCTEEEAMAAAEMVQSMLHKYQLDLSEIEIRESKVIQGAYDTGLRGNTPLEWTVSAIAFFTDCKAWIGRNEHREVVYKYFGLEHDVMIAEYITKICDWAIIWEAEEWKTSSDQYASASGSRRGKLKHDFQYGMALRLAKRIREMKRKQDNSMSTGTDLVVVKSAVVDQEFAKLGLNLSKARGGGKKSIDPGAYAAGAAAGDKVKINPGVGHTATRKLN